MPQRDILLVSPRDNPAAIRRQLAPLHRALDKAIYWPARLRLRRQIEEAQRNLVAALQRRRAHIHRGPP